MTRADPGRLGDLVDAVGPRVAVRGVLRVVLGIAHERRDLLPGRGGTLALHEATLDVHEVRRGGDPMRVPGGRRHYERHVVGPQPLELRRALVGRVLSDDYEAHV